MPEKTNALNKTNNKNIIQNFIAGARDGWNVFIKNVLPAVLMAYVLINILQVTKLMDLLGKICGPVMRIFGLPGSSIVVIVSAFFSVGGGFATDALMVTKAQLTAQQATILMPAIMLGGGLAQTWARCVLVADVPAKHQKWVVCISIIDAIIALFVMRLIVSVF